MLRCVLRNEAGFLNCSPWPLEDHECVLQEGLGISVTRVSVCACTPSYCVFWMKCFVTLIKFSEVFTNPKRFRNTRIEGNFSSDKISQKDVINYQMEYLLLKRMFL